MFRPSISASRPWTSTLGSRWRSCAWKTTKQTEDIHCQLRRVIRVPSTSIWTAVSESMKAILQSFQLFDFTASTSAIGQGNSARLNGDQRTTTICRIGTAKPFGISAATSSNALLWHNELSPLGFPDYNPMLAQLARVSDVEQNNVSNHRPISRRRSRRERRNSEGRRRQRRRHRHRHRRTYRQASSDNPLLQIGTPDDSRTQVSLSIRFAEDSVFNRFLQWVMEQ